jgi:protein required for attachment to host cells
MKRALIAIVDAAHARLYTYQGENGDAALREQRDLVNAGRQAHGMFSTTKPGANRWSPIRNSTDDHRDDHIAEMDVRFAKVVVDEVARLAREEGFAHVILVAGPQMLGELRRANGALRDFSVDEVAQDLAWLTSPQVHDHLAAMNLIDPRPRAFARAR